MPATDSTSLTIEIHEGLAHVVFDRPESRNALDHTTCRRLTEFLADADRDRSIRAIVISGGARDFCTGADTLGAPAPQTPQAPPAAQAPMDLFDVRRSVAGFERLFQQMWETETPVVTAVTGTVAGIGWMLALLADLVVAAQGSRWTHVFTRRGMVPHAGDTYFLPRIIPFHRLNEIALLSDTIDADTLYSWGIVNRCVPSEQVVPTALELGTRLASGPTRAFAMTKRLYRRSLDHDMATGFEVERAAHALVTSTKDRQEGVAAFREGRRPEFIGE